jgi:hypothetical protein
VQTIDRRRFNTGLFLGSGLAGCAQMPAGDPDLIVTGLRWSTDDGATWGTGPIQAGSNVLFEADVKNQGAGPTPDGVIIGVVFLVDGNSVAWSDTHTSALPADQTVSLRANGEPDGDKFWNNAPAGNHTIRAWVDDINRIPNELNESNNTLDVPLSVTSGGGLQPPPQAAAAGYTRLVFQEEFGDLSGIDVTDSRQPGFNFYIYAPFGFRRIDPANISIANSVMTWTGVTPAQVNGNFYSTAGIGGSNYVGFAPTGGAYIEASLAWDPADYHQGAVPAFWTQSNEHMWQNDQANFSEIDIMEWFTFNGNNSFYQASHLWASVGNDISNTLQNSEVIVPTQDWRQFHRWGVLWLPGQAINYYFNDQKTSASFNYAPNHQMFQYADDDHWCITLGCDAGMHMKVDWVRVWQAP